MATKVVAMNLPDDSKARIAAFWPALSGSNVKITSEGKSELPSNWLIFLMCSSPKAVPQVATAVVMPAM